MEAPCLQDSVFPQALAAPDVRRPGESAETGEATRGSAAQVASSLSGSMQRGPPDVATAPAASKPETAGAKEEQERTKANKDGRRPQKKNEEATEATADEAAVAAASRRSSARGPPVEQHSASTEPTPISDRGAPAERGDAGYAFKVYEPGSLTFRDIDDCGWGEFDLLAERESIPEDMPMLLVVGQQKAGTTWLYDALKTHLSLIHI